MNSDFIIKNSFSKFIEIFGEDSSKFLQSLITNDIQKCKINNPIYSCLLSPQGKFLADFFIIFDSNKYLIEIHEKYINSFLTKLQAYKLRAKVEFTLSDDIESYIFFSENKAEVKNSLISFKDPRSPNIGLKIFLNKENKKNILNIKEYNFIKYEEILMKNLIPYSPNDLIENKSLLLENNFQNINAISWDKGCYVGQEITARMKYRALLKKQIYVLELISGKVDKGADIIINDTNFGKIISISNQYVLCMLKINLVNDKYRNKEKLEINNSIILKFL